MVQTYEVKMENMEVRKVEDEVLDICDKSYPRFKISFDDENGKRLVFIDGNRKRLDSYKRGQVGTLILKMTNEVIVKDFENGSRYFKDTTKVEIEDFILND